MTRRNSISCLVVFSATVLAVAGYSLYITWQPSEPEKSIRDDLVLRGLISESANVSVVKRTTLFDAASNRIDCVTVCVKDEPGYYLARLRRLGQDPHDVGGRWSTLKDFWRSYDRRPSSKEIKEYTAYDEEYLQRMSVEGWLPRPAGRQDFRASKVSMRVSAAVDDLDLNEGIDQTRLASLVVRDEGVSGRMRLGRFTLAPFHKPLWFAAADGLQTVRDYIDLLETRLERCPDEKLRRELEEDLETLRTVENRLEALDANGGTFHFLAQDDK